jgi:hypothetical protein
LFATVFHGSVPFGMSPYGTIDVCQHYVCCVALYCMLCVICPWGCWMRCVRLHDQWRCT